MPEIRGIPCLVLMLTGNFEPLPLAERTRAKKNLTHFRENLHFFSHEESSRHLDERTDVFLMWVLSLGR